MPIYLDRHDAPDEVTAHIANPILNTQFTYLKENPEQMELVKRHMREFLGAGTGGSEQYTGKNISTTHQGMSVSDKEFLAVVDDVLLVLTQHNMDDQTKKDMLYILYSFKDQIIER